MKECIYNNAKCVNQKKSLIHIISIFRFYVILSIIISMFGISDYINYMVIGLVFLICFFAIVDIFINDILPDRFYVKFLYNYRHIVYMILSILLFGISAEYTYLVGYTYKLIRIWLDGSIVAAIAVSDIFIRHMHIKEPSVLDYNVSK